MRCVRVDVNNYASTYKPKNEDPKFNSLSYELGMDLIIKGQIYAKLSLLC